MNLFTQVFAQVYKEAQERKEAYREELRKLHLSGVSEKEADALAVKYDAILDGILNRAGAEGSDTRRVYCLYEQSVNEGNEMINIAEGLFDAQAQSLMDAFHKCGVEKFTVSSRSTALMDNLWIYTSNGYCIETMTQVMENGVLVKAVEFGRA